MILSLLITLVSLLSGEEKELRMVEDLKPRWMILDGESLRKFEAPSKMIYLTVDLDKMEPGFLDLQSRNDFYLFVNTFLVSKGNHFRLKTDSLKEKYGVSIRLSFFQSEGISDLSTRLVILKPLNPLANTHRPDNSFSNFMVMATVLLVIFFTTLLRTNPQLTLDYLSVIKLFSLKRRDETQFTLRVTSSVNLLFYFFCGLLTSLAILVASRYSADGLSVINDKLQLSTVGYFGEWLLVSLIVCLILMLKLGVVSLFTLLFGMRDTSGFQFFNFVRALVVSLTIIGSTSIFCFWIGIHANYYFLMKCFCAMLMLGVILMYLKLLTRESSNPFHLFSYLCATEIFPLMILIKVLLF